MVNGLFHLTLSTLMSKVKSPWRGGSGGDRFIFFHWFFWFILCCFFIILPLLAQLFARICKHGLKNNRILKCNAKSSKQPYCWWEQKHGGTLVCHLLLTGQLTCYSDPLLLQLMFLFFVFSLNMAHKWKLWALKQV